MTISITVRKTLANGAAVLFWVVVWQLAAMAANRTLLLPIPTPADTLCALARMAAKPDFWLTVGMSLLRICAGFALAFAAGALGAAASAQWSLFRRLAAPLIQLVRSIPVAVFTIVVFLWVSRPYIPSTIVFLTGLPVIWGGVEAGLENADRQLWEMARTFGMGRWQILRRITLPGIRPHVAAAVTTALGFAWKSGIAAEVICGPRNAIGTGLKNAKAYLETPEVFAWTVTVVVLSVLLGRLLRRLVRKGRAKP